MGFELVDRGIPRHDHPVVDVSGAVIGKVTSGTMSPLNKPIGMAYVPTANAAGERDPDRCAWQSAERRGGETALPQPWLMQMHPQMAQMSTEAAPAGFRVFAPLRPICSPDADDPQ